MAPQSIAQLVQRNVDYSQSHQPIASLAERAETQTPKVTTMIITCMDHRCIPEKFFHLDVGDAFVVRNLGGSAKAALREIVFADQIVGLKEIAVIHHTDCGTSHFDQDTVRERLEKAFLGQHQRFEWMEFKHIRDLEQSVRDDLEDLRQTSSLRRELVEASQGFIFDIKTGKLVKVA